MYHNQLFQNWHFIICLLYALCNNTRYPVVNVIHECSLSGNDSSLLDLVPLNSSASAAMSLDYSTVEEFHRVGEGYVLAAIVLFGVSANVFSIIVMR